MKYKSIQLLIAVSFIFSCTLIIEGCKKTDVSPGPPPIVPGPPPSISKFSPVISGIGYPVTITGTNFSEDVSSIKVTINGVSASVVSASSTQLIVTVPLSASTGKISVSVKGQVIASSSDITVKKLTVSTFAGGGGAGYSDGTGIAASFSGPGGIVSDHNGNYYVADTWNNRIRKITSVAAVTTLSGTDFQGNKDGNIDSATFTHPSGVAMDSQGNLFVSDNGNNTIRKITPNGIVSTFAGDPNGSAGYIDATGTSARFSSPGAIAIDGNDNMFISDGTNKVIRKITSTGVVTTFAGSGLTGSADGNGPNASFNQPTGLVTDPDGNLFVADYGNNNIRKITPAGVVTTIAGNGVQGTADGPALSASFSLPTGIVRDQNGNFYITDALTFKIRMITSDNIVVTLAGGNDQGGSIGGIDGVGHFASFSVPGGIAIDPDGVMYELDSYSGAIRKLIVQ